MYGARKLHCPRRGLHATITADEQRDFEKISKPVEGLTYSRLTEPIPDCHAGYIALGHEGIEYDKQI
jgi:hypothetical protein